MNFFDSSFPEWTGPIAVLFFIFFIGLFYKTSLKKNNSYEELPTAIFMLFLFIQWIRKTTNQILGNNYKFAVPFFIYIIFYFWISCIISILGFPAIGSSIEIPVSISLIVFVGTIASGIYHKRKHYIDDYLVWIKYKNKKFPIPEPFAFVGEVSKIISLACRLWGNSLAGSIIIFVCYYSIDSLFKSIDMGIASIFVIPTFVFPLHIYFDIIEGGIQSLIFMLLTMSYWSMASKSHK